MNGILNLIFCPWLNENQREIVSQHKRENFTYVRYERGGKAYTGALNQATKEVMWEDPNVVLSLKCVIILLLGNPIDMLLREIFYTAKLVVDLVKGFFLAENVFAILIEGVSNIARTLFYGVGISLACLGGIVIDPLKARRRIGFMHENLNRGVSVHQYRKMLKAQTEGDPQFSNAECIQAFYIAECMQPWVKDIRKDGYHITAQSNNYKDVTSDKNHKECPCPNWCVIPLLPCLESV